MCVIASNSDFNFHFPKHFWIHFCQVFYLVVWGLFSYWFLGVLYESEKVKVTQSCLTLCDLMDYTVHGILQARILEWVAFPFSRGSSQPRDQTQVSHIASGFFTAEPPGKPNNTAVGSLSLLQEIFLTQESNWGLLHCRRILYQLSHQGGPKKGKCQV